MNRRMAIRLKCMNCSAWIPKDVRNCVFAGCHLFPFRTGRGKQNAKGRYKAIRLYCLWCMNGQRKEIRLCPSADCPLFSYRLGSIDRPSKINSMQKNDHIGFGFERKKETEYLSV
jgi:hypothetical protein